MAAATARLAAVALATHAASAAAGAHRPATAAAARPLAGEAPALQQHHAAGAARADGREPGDKFDFEYRESGTNLRTSATFAANLWRGASRAYDFRHMDDLEPVAPMDRLAPDGSDEVVDVPGAHRHALYVPPYMNPDSFPTVSGPSCDCERSEPAPLTPSEMEWARIVADQLGVPVDKLPRGGANKCSCDNSTGSEVYHWANLDPIKGGTGYRISPADVTYASGDYWEPQVAPGGVVAPEDRLPKDHYPIQARSDRISPLPTTALEDKIGVRFARYIDQLEARRAKCDDSSPECTTPCKAGDQVVLAMGNRALNATVVSLHLARRVRVEFVPPSLSPEPAVGGGAACLVAAGCDPFRFCLGAAGGDGSSAGLCVEPRGVSSQGLRGALRRSLACPRGTAPCATVQQDVAASRLRRGGRACAPLASDPAAA
ncbi:unnamed protein product [Prorocentrum cordatum]|uniref:Uncharacterized protein n=1 Tax=Prorocentrum cordatum TaxID=2364126 RepID=A0ABN9WDS2_9DINO|nr:unnamed protein product [Polarella glacialis]